MIVASQWFRQLPVAVSRFSLHVIPDNLPERCFTGRLLNAGQWHRIEVDRAGGGQIRTPGGTTLGLMCHTRIEGGLSPMQFWVIIDWSRLPYENQPELDKVKLWLPKIAVMFAVAVLAKNQTIPESGLFTVAAPDYTKDPQREDAHAFRRRCRFDVLNMVTSCVNSNPPVTYCKYATLAGAVTHTRIYSREDLIDAIQFWAQKGFVSLLNRAGDIQIKQVRDDEMMAELSKYSWEEATPSPAEATPTRLAAAATPTEFDVFVCHASEDKAAVVVPLSDELVRRGLCVWVDYRELRLGDHLRARIDEGLRCSRFGIVIVSPRFFAKPWPQSELDGLVALEMADGRKRILPIWHDVEYEDVAQRSPTLAARLATKWREGLDKVVDEITRAICD